jgi:D-sedoheptulose 7-phosphate isomerase
MRDDLLAEILPEYMAEVTTAIEGVPLAQVAAVAEELVRARLDDKTVFVFGNGGSAATASHLASDLAKTAAVNSHGGLKTVCLSDNTALLTAWANDTSYDNVFAAPLENQIGPGDVAIGISVSGQSPNVLRAIEVARDAGATTVGLSGFGGGKLNEIADIGVVVPSYNYGPVEDIHLVLSHALTWAVRRSLDEALAAEHRGSDEEWASLVRPAYVPAKEPARATDQTLKESRRRSRSVASKGHPSR